MLTRAVVLLGIGLAGAAQAATNQTSQAVELLYERPYLTTVAPGRLVYSYEMTNTDPATYGSARRGSLVVTMTPSGSQGNKNASIERTLDDKSTTIGPMADYAGNPVILPFFEDDLFLVKRYTGIDATYFRRVFGDALLDRATVEPVRVTHDGREIDAQRISMQPFSNLPQSDKFKQFVGKTYEIIVSEAVPGGIYSMTTTVPGTTAAAQTSTMRFVRSEAGR